MARTHKSEEMLLEILNMARSRKSDQVLLGIPKLNIQLALLPSILFHVASIFSCWRDMVTSCRMKNVGTVQLPNFVIPFQITAAVSAVTATSINQPTRVKSRLLRHILRWTSLLELCNAKLRAFTGLHSPNNLTMIREPMFKRQLFEVQLYSI